MYEIQSLALPDHMIDRIHKEGKLLRDEVISELDDMGAFYLLTSSSNEKKSALGLAVGDHIERVVEQKWDWHGVKPRDKAQVCLFHALENMDLTVVLGAAGTGKTTVAVAYALHMMFRHGKKIVLSKPSSFVGKTSNAIAAVPGDAREKIAPYIESFMLPMKRLLGSHAEHHLYEMEEKGMLMFQPLELIRGMHFEDTIVIIDEAQNTDPHQLLSLISRVSETSKCIVMGDPSQIDLDLRWRETGLHALIESDSFFDDDICTYIKLKAQYRGPLADLAANILEELMDDD